MDTSQSSDTIPTVPSPLTLATPTSELLNPSDALSASSTGSTKPRSDSVSVLKSSRPAPPSPASSRPGSQQFIHSPILDATSPRDRSGSSSSSRISSSVQRKVSGASSRHSDRDGNGSKPSRRKSTLGQNFSLPDDVEGGVPAVTDISTSTSTSTPTGNDTPKETTSLSATPLQEGTPAQSPPPSSPRPKQDSPVKEPKDPFEIKIRDYGFPSTDEKHFGRGQPDKKRWRLSSFTLGRRPSGSASGTGSPDPSEDDKKSWGGFGLFGWRGFKKRSMSSTSSPDSPINDEPEDTDDVVEDDFFSDDHDDEGEEPRGTYRVVFQFISEGSNEMGVNEGDVIQVTGRGGGEGWVVATMGGREGLVPEGYLEKIADREEAIEELDEEPVVKKAETGDAAESV